ARLRGGQQRGVNRKYSALVDRGRFPGRHGTVSHARQRSPVQDLASIGPAHIHQSQRTIFMASAQESIDVPKREGIARSDFIPAPDARSNDHWNMFLRQWSDIRRIILQALKVP